MATCMAQATRYVGKGPERKAYSGPCVLDLGHDLDHLPAQLAMEQQYDSAFNAGVEAAAAEAESAFADRLKHAGDSHMREEFQTVVEGVLDDLRALRRG